MNNSPKEHLQRGAVSRVSQRLRKQVFERDRHTCRMCGASKGDADEYRPHRKIRLRLGRVRELVHGGTNTLDNLRTLCNVCYEGCQQMTREPPPSWIQVMALLSKAEISEQKKVLNRLRKRFPEAPECPNASIH